MNNAETRLPPAKSAREAGNLQAHAFEEEQRQYYNKIARVYDEHYHSIHSIRYRRDIFDSILGSFDLRGKRVLDAMCGGGESTSYFLARGATVCGQDISDEQCRIYAERYPECEVQRSSILETGFADNDFDLVVVESLHHLHPNLAAGIKEIERILRPGGHFMLWEPAAGSLLDLARKVWYRLDPKYFLNNEKSISIKNILNLADGRFEPVKVRYGGNFGYMFVASSMHWRITPKMVGLYAPILMALEGLLNRVQPRQLACWVLAVLRKR
jgi:SAM-dependent methyltransferase